ncbi:hypothetical protein RYX36_030342 [Vicia faba]
MQQSFFDIVGQTLDLIQKERDFNFGDHKDVVRSETNEGMNNRLAERIQKFLKRLVDDHRSIDLEWLRDVPLDQAKEYLLSVRGLGLKSVECVRLLTMHHLAFPVDTNVGRKAVRLGWLDQKTLYELHYQMIKFGKVFCTKSKPNCNACPMRAKCRHFASAFASARLALPGPEQKSIVIAAGNSVPNENPHVVMSQSSSLMDKVKNTMLLQEMQLEGAREVNCFDPFNTEALSSGILKNKYENEMNTPSFQTDESTGCVAVTHSQTNASQVHPQEQKRNFNFGDHKDVVRSETNEVTSDPIKKTKNQLQEEKEQFDSDSLRRKAQAKAGKREKTEDTMDSLDWDAVRCADVGDIANTIKERGMNNRLAEHIQKFLKRMVDDHKSINLEWLRDVPPDQAKEYLLSVRGLGLKSLECVRLLTLHHLAFPIDTNVGRIAVQLGWVPLQPLPESL